MILCLCASPALDLTYRVGGLAVGSTNRVREVDHRPGGKAINVARLLHALGEAVTVLTTAGGDSGADLIAGLEREGILYEAVTSETATRRTIAIVDETTHVVTMLNEPAALEDWPRFRAAAEALIPAADVVVISGRLPNGAPPDAFAQLTRVAHRHERPVVVDTSGPALLATLAARPTIVKPNAEELRECTTEDDPMLAARELAQKWQVTVVASLGAAGLVAVTGDATWRARSTQELSGNPTGAGDAVVAGLARGLRTGVGLESLLADCVALGAASVLAPHAGELSHEDYQRELLGVVVELPDGVTR
jgi:tagatose 6-phosphate kinase